jgi:hypothetical protein
LFIADEQDGGDGENQRDDGNDDEFAFQLRGSYRNSNASGMGNFNLTSAVGFE